MMHSDTRRMLGSLALCLIQACTAGSTLLGAAHQFLGPGAPMRYLANASDPEVGAWWTFEFDDAAWTEGTYAVGYNAGALIATPVGSDARSVYTRALFVIDDPRRVLAVELAVDHDDGFVAWLNGTEIGRGTMDDGDPAWDTIASASHESSNSLPPVYGTVLDATAKALPALRAGTNILAIGVWNRSATSTDLALVPRLALEIIGPRPPGVTINELLCQPRGPGAAEFIELVNASAQPVDVGGWLLQGRNDFEAFALPAGTTLGSDAYLAVFLGVDTPPPGADPGAIAGRGLTLPDAADELRLLDASRGAVDVVAYRIDPPETGPPTAPGTSLELIHPLADNDVAANWSLSTETGGTPGRPNSRLPQAPPPAILRAGRQPPAPRSTDPIRFVAEVVWPGATGQVDLVRRLGTEQEWARVPLFDDGTHDDGQAGDWIYGASLDPLPVGTVLLYYFEATSAAAGAPQAVWPPSAPRSVESCAAADAAPRAGAIVINELMYNATSQGGPADDWIELLNPGADPVDLGGWTLYPAGSVRPFRFPAPTPVPSGAFAVLTGDPASFQAAHGELPRVFGPPEFGLDDRQGRVLLADPNGRVIDAAAYADTAPWPGLAGGTGVSLERIEPGRDGADPTNWGARMQEGTPGQANSVAHPGAPPAPVVINEILFAPYAEWGPGAYEDREEFVELFNRGVDPVNLAGWSLAGGIDHQFGRTVVQPGQVVVVARDLAAFEARYGSAPDALVSGPYHGRLGNGSDQVVLVDPHGTAVDVVHYYDGWPWPRDAEYSGSSIELRHPWSDNATGPAWAASQPPEAGGTPGAPNSQLAPEPPPQVLELRHEPPVPGPADRVCVTARIVDCTPPAQVDLVWRSDPQPAATRVAMSDDGLHGDGLAGDGVYAAFLPPQAASQVIAFYVEAASSGTGATGRWPPDPVEALYQVEETPPQTVLPIYRVVMRAAELTELVTRSARSDVELPATFIAGDEIRYGVGLRYRGKGDRSRTPHPFRVHFNDGEPFEGEVHLNLNARDIQAEGLSMHLFGQPEPGVSAPRAAYAYLVVMVGDLTYAAANSGPVVRIQAPDANYERERFLAGPDGRYGNLYRGNWDNTPEANFAHPLPATQAQPDLYKTVYRKENNERLDDFSDLDALCAAFTYTPDAALFDEMSKLLDADQWARWFAVNAMVNNTETNLYNSRGDDYITYHDAISDKFVLIPWDQDGAFQTPTASVFICSVPNMRRLLLRPEFAGRYMRYVRELYDGLFSPQRIEPMIAGIERTHRAASIGRSPAQIRDYVGQRRAYLATLLGVPFTLEVDRSGTTRTWIAAGTQWRYFKGTQAPAPGLEWTRPEFSDSGWELGCSGFGYGDGDDCTVLGDMEDLYISVYLRTSFDAVDLARLERLTLGITYDDGFVAYLNGAELDRRNVDGDPPAFDTPANDVIEPTQVTIDLDLTGPDAPRPGANTLAIQVHNGALDSTDLSLIPVLRAVYPPPSFTETADGLLTDASEIRLQGTVAVEETLRVVAGGQTAAYDPTRAAWGPIALPLAPGPNRIAIRRIGLAENVLEQLELTVIRTGAAPAGWELR